MHFPVVERPVCHRRAGRSLLSGEPFVGEQRVVSCRRAYRLPFFAFRCRRRALRCFTSIDAMDGRPFTPSLDIHAGLHNPYVSNVLYRDLPAGQDDHICIQSLFILIISEITHDISSPVTISWSSPLRNNSFHSSVNKLKHP